MIRLWMGYQLLRIACWFLPYGTRNIIEHQINEAIDMANDPGRRAEWLALKARAMEGRDG